MKKLISDVCTKSVFYFSNSSLKEIDGVSAQSSANYLEKKSRNQTKLYKTEKRWGPVQKASGEISSLSSGDTEH